MFALNPRMHLPLALACCVVILCIWNIEYMFSYAGLTCDSDHFLKGATVPAAFIHNQSVVAALSSRPNGCEATCPCRLTSRVDTLRSSCYGASDTAWSRAVSIPHYPEQLCPQNYRNLADWVYRWYGPYHDENLLEVPIAEAAPCLPPGAIIFVRGWDIADFFDNIYPQLLHPFVLVTAETDLSVPSAAHLNFVTGSSKVIHWFAQNGLRVPQRARFTAIPIGLNCRDQSYKISSVTNSYRQQLAATQPSPSSSSATQLDVDPIRLFNQTTPDKLMLINFDPSSDPTGYRNMLWAKACTADAADNWLHFADCITKEHGVRQYVGTFEQIYERNLHYRFWLSPRGNGLDCHRTWEAFYLGRIPVLRSCDLDGLYEGLPVVIVDDLLTLSEEFLLAQWELIVKRYQQGKYSFEKLTRRYWENQILSKSMHSGIDADDIEVKRMGRCWWPR